MQETIYLNGEILPADQAKIHVSDLGLLRGYGIFDFFRAIDGKPIFMEDHLDRFENSARLMNLPIPENRDTLRAIILNLIVKNPHQLLGIKMIMTGGYSLDGYTPAEKSNLIILPKPFAFKESRQSMKLLSLEYQREIPEIKTLNYAVPILAIPKMKAIGAEDVIYHKDGFISELSRSNVFIVKNEKIITPKEGVLYGISRKHVLSFGKKQFEVEERAVSTKEFYEADEVFTTGSTKRVIAIGQVDNHIFSEGKIGKVTSKLQELFLEEEKSYA